jgi:hypothetical protein
METRVLDMVAPIHKLATIVQPVNIRIKMEAKQHLVRHVMSVNRRPQLPWRVLFVRLDKAKKKLFQRSTVVINAAKEKLLLRLPPCVLSAQQESINP